MTKDDENYERMKRKLKFAKDCLKAIAEFDDGTNNIGKSRLCGTFNEIAKTCLKALDHV